MHKHPVKIVSIWVIQVVCSVLSPQEISWQMSVMTDQQAVIKLWTMPNHADYLVQKTGLLLIVVTLQDLTEYMLDRRITQFYHHLCSAVDLLFFQATIYKVNYHDSWHVSWWIADNMSWICHVVVNVGLSVFIACSLHVLDVCSRGNKDFVFICSLWIKSLIFIYAPAWTVGAPIKSESWMVV